MYKKLITICILIITINSCITTYYKANNENIKNLLPDESNIEEIQEKQLTELVKIKL